MFLVLKKISAIVALFLASNYFQSANIEASDSLTIRIDEGTIRALSLGIVPIRGAVSQNISDIVGNNLKLSGRFDIFNSEDMVSAPAKFEEVNFKSWRIFGVENILVGQMATSAAGYNLVVELIDVLRQTKIFRKVSVQF